MNIKRRKEKNETDRQRQIKTRRTDATIQYYIFNQVYENTHSRISRTGRALIYTYPYMRFVQTASPFIYKFVFFFFCISSSPSVPSVLCIGHPYIDSNQITCIERLAHIHKHHFRVGLLRSIFSQTHKISLYGSNGFVRLVCTSPKRRRHSHYHRIYSSHRIKPK